MSIRTAEEKDFDVIKKSLTIVPAQGLWKNAHGYGRREDIFCL